MFVATSINLPKSGSISHLIPKPSSRQTQRLAPRAASAFIFQKNNNTSDNSDATKLRREDSVSQAHAMKTSADNKQHSAKDSDKTRAVRKAIEGTNLFSIDDDFSYLTVEDLLTA